MSDDVESAEAWIDRHAWTDDAVAVAALEARDRLIAKRERERCVRVCIAFSLCSDRVHTAVDCANALERLPDEEPAT